MHILTILTCPLNTYVIRLHNLNSINIFFTITDHSFYFIVVKQKLKTNKLKKPLKTQTSLNPISMNVFVSVKNDSFPL